MIEKLLELSRHQDHLLFFLAKFFPPLSLLLLLFLLFLLFGYCGFNVFDLRHAVGENSRRKLAQKRVRRTGRGTSGTKSLKYESQVFEKDQKIAVSVQKK